MNSVTTIHSFLSVLWRSFVCFLRPYSYSYGSNGHTNTGAITIINAFLSDYFQNLPKSIFGEEMRNNYCSILFFVHLHNCCILFRWNADLMEHQPELVLCRMRRKHFKIRPKSLALCTSIAQTHSKLNSFIWSIHWSYFGHFKNIPKLL